MLQGWNALVRQVADRVDEALETERLGKDPVKIMSEFRQGEFYQIQRDFFVIDNQNCAHSRLLQSE